MLAVFDTRDDHVQLVVIANLGSYLENRRCLI